MSMFTPDPDDPFAKAVAQAFEDGAVRMTDLPPDPNAPPAEPDPTEPEVEPEVEPEPDDDAELEVEPEGGELEPDLEPQGLTVKVNGQDRTVSPADAVRLLALADAIRSDPSRAERILAILQGREPTEPPTAIPPRLADLPAPPPEIEDDPVARALWTRLQAVEQQSASYQDLLSRHEALINEQQQTEAAAIYNRARRDFQAEYKLSADDMDRIDARAAELQVLPGLVRSGLDRHAATMEAFKIGMRADDVLYERAMAERTVAAQKAKDRKARASSVGSGSGSTPRVPAAAEGQSRDELMLAAFREAMNK